jgi:hypothetical protein
MTEKSEYKVIPVDQIVPNDWNANEMDDFLFNQLSEDIGDENVGNLQPILVAPNEDGSYRIIDGEHRYEAARLNGDTEVPCIVAKGKLAEDEDSQKFQTVRMNKIRGRTNQKKFIELVKDLSKRHTLEDMARNLVFEDPSELEALIENARKSLSPEMRKEFDKAKEEIKTVEDLSLVLNKLFTQYGKTLTHNFMIMDFGGKKHLWVRFKNAKSFKKIAAKAKLCLDEDVTFDSVVVAAVEKIDKKFLEGNKDSLEKPEPDDEVV